ncbi:hypothetical protein EXE10_00420 [Acinetobacter sp. WCHAc060033]|nr:hypothetical protein EXE10_00420 [Acinetobacter sp. WCHAc060033]
MSSMDKSIQKALLTINISLAILWIYQGIVPKIIFKATEERKFWEFLEIDQSSMMLFITLSGVVEIMYGCLFLVFRQSKPLHYLNIFGLAGLAVTVAIIYPQYFTAGFNPFAMNVAMATLSVVAIQLINIQHSQNVTT